MRHHLAAAKRVSLAAGLERLGLPVELRFRRHLLRHLLRRFVHAPVLPERGAPPAGNTSRGGATWESFLQGRQQAKSTDPQASQKQISMYDICDEEYSDRFLKDVKIRAAPGSPGHAKYTDALNNYCTVGKLVNTQERDPARGVDWSSLKGLDEISPATRPGTDEELAKYASDDVQSKRLWRQRRAMETMGWGDKTHLAKDTSIARVRNLYMEVLSINLRVDRVTEKIRVAMEKDWLDVVKPPKKRTTFQRATAIMAGAATWLAKYIKKIASNTKAFFTNIWRSFVRLLSTSERACQTREAQIQREQSRKLLQPGNRNDANSVDYFVEKVTKKKVNELQEEAAKLEKVMDKVSEANAGTATTEDLEREVDVVKNDQERLQRAMTGDTDHDTQPPEKLLEQMDEADKHAEIVEADWCKVTNKQSMDGMHKAMGKVMQSAQGEKSAVRGRDAARRALELSLPLLGIRGIGVAAGGLGGGFEEVVDFRNMEIGLFKWGSGAFGTSSTGASLGGYAGFGWKGYKENWTMEEGYQTGIFISHGLNLAITGLPVGFGMTYATDADNSQPGPWIPEPHGINEVVFGWTVGASLSNVVVPMNFDVGASYFGLLHAECYDDNKELLKYIWLPTCRRNEKEGRGGCFQGPESSNIETLRTGIHAATPIIPDLAFTILASLYDSVRDPTYERRCSDTSTNFRNDITRFILRIGQLIQQAVEKLKGLERDMAALDESLRTAMAVNDIELEKTSEFKAWRKSLEVEMSMCEKGPPDVQGADTKREGLRSMQIEELVELCEPLGLDAYCTKDGARGYHELVVQRLALAVTLRDGDVTRRELRELSRVLRRQLPKKPDEVNTEVKNAIEKLAETCEDKCASGAEVWKILAKLSQDSLLKLCTDSKAGCRRRTRVSRFLGGAFDWLGQKPYDRQMLAMIITNTHGLGTLDASGDENQFGACTSDDACPAVGSVCPKLSDMHEAEDRGCKCDTKTCYTLNPDTGEEACVEPGSSVHQVLYALRSKYGTYIIQTGLILGQLKVLAVE